jgi:hypothetical protein
MFGSQFAYLVWHWTRIVSEDEYARWFGFFAQCFVTVFVQLLQLYCLFFFYQFCICPLNNGKFLFNSFKFGVLIWFFCTNWIKSNCWKIHQLIWLLKFLCLSYIKLSNSSFQWCCNCFPFLIKLDTCWTISLIKVNKIWSSFLKEWTLPIILVQNKNIRFLS